MRQLKGVALTDSFALLFAAAAAAECVDLNTAALDELQGIEHVGETFAEAIVDGRPWRHVRGLRQIHGIGPGRLRDIKEQGLACVADPHPELIVGQAVVLDGDTLEVAGERVRLIGIDAPEASGQMCQIGSGSV